MGSMLLICLVALVFFWARRRTFLDQWFMVVLWSLIAELLLVAWLNSSRFTLGWYGGRMMSLVTATVVMVVLLTETMRLYGRLARSNELLQRERRNKLMNLEAMLASIAHEVRQPLGAIAALGDAALVRLGQTPPNLEAIRLNLNGIVSANQRAGGVFDNIRDLFGKTDPEHEPVDVNKIITEVLRALESELEDRSIAIRAELTPDPPLVMGHRGQLQEVLFNLVRNAIEAMDAIKDGSRVLQVTTERRGSNEVAVLIEDSGPGIDPKKLDGIFDAFVSTKQHGMGLGLAICRIIIDRHGGQLSAQPRKVRGAVFQFTLPNKAV